MRKKIVSSLCLIVLTFQQLLAQNFTIQGTDASAYPVVKSTIQLATTAKVQQSDFKVTENGAELPFTITPAGAASSSGAASNTAGGDARTVYFLIEASGATYGGATENFKKAVSQALDQLGENDKVNIGYFGKANKNGRALNTISAEFTSDRQLLKQEMLGKVTASRDTNYQSDVFKSIYECLEFIESKQDLSGDKMLIVLSAAINNSRSPIQADDCIDKALKMNIPVYTVTYKTNNRYASDNFVRLSDKTNAQTQTAKTTNEIATALTGFLGAAPAQQGGSDNANATTGDQYVIQFTSMDASDESIKTYAIEYQGQKAAATYTPSEGGAAGENPLKKYALPIVIVVVIAGALSFWLINQATRKKTEEAARQADEERKLREAEERNQRLQDELRRQQHQQQSRQDAPVAEPQKHDLKKTMISGGGGAPTLAIASGTFNKMFPINKPQMSIGRAANNDIVIPETTVSSNHAVLVNEGGHFYLQDLGSTNGTFVNGTKITKQLLKPGDMIKMGAANIRFQL